MSQLENMPLIRHRRVALGGFRCTCGLPRQTRGQHGTIAVMFAVLLIVILGFCGLALDLSRLYNRKVEMQNMADAVALAAARKLNGTPGGIAAAVNAAQQMATTFHYQYNQLPVSWSDAALTFSTSSSRAGSWVDSGTAAGQAAKIFYVKVDTQQLDPAQGTVDMSFMPILSRSLAAFELSGNAVAGRAAIDVTPLAICAMDPAAAGQRVWGTYTELVEYGFRRGISYNLMRLNPQSNSSGANYVVNPIAAPGSAGASSDTDASTVGPFVCTGSMASPGLIGGKVLVTDSFPLDLLYNQLNSRFDIYANSSCDFHGAPPDRNIKEYVYSSIPWIRTMVNGQASDEEQSNSMLRTKADLAAPGGTAAQDGLVWAYAKAAQYAASPPASGYSTLGTGAWPDLYGGQKVSASNPYPSKPPYQSNTTGPYFAAPSSAHQPGLDSRRVLNIPLLSCPVPAGSNVEATVLAIGKFFMTVRAAPNTIYAEFGGAMPLSNVTGDVSLYR